MNMPQEKERAKKMSCDNKTVLFSSPACQIHKNCGDVISISIGPATIRINQEMLLHLSSAIDTALAKTELDYSEEELISKKKKFKLIH